MLSQKRIKDYCVSWLERIESFTQVINHAWRLWSNSCLPGFPCSGSQQPKALGGQLWFVALHFFLSFFWDVLGHGSTKTREEEKMLQNNQSVRASSITQIWRELNVSSFLFTFLLTTTLLVDSTANIHHSAQGSGKEFACELIFLKLLTVLLFPSSSSQSHYGLEM